MEYRPKRNNKKATIAMLICIGGAVACLLFSWMDLGYNTVNQLLILCFLTAGIFVLTRYILADFVYCITEDGYFEIKKISSKKIPITLASVKISANDIIVQEKKDMSEYGVMRKERFNLSMRAENLYWYIFTVNGERQALILECDKTYVEYLRNLINASNGSNHGD